MKLLYVLLYTGIYTRHTISTNPIMRGLMNIIHAYLQNTIMHQFLYNFNRTHKDLSNKILIN